MPEFDDDYAPQQPHQKKGDAPNKIGERIMAEHELATDATTGVCYHYTGTHWAEAPDQWLLHLALVADGNLQTSARRRSEIVSFVKARTTIAALRWGRVGDHEIPFLNGVVNVLTYEIRAHDPLDYLERVVPWEFDPLHAAPCLTWRAALETWFGDNERGAGLIAGLQEFCGYVLLPHAKYKRAMLCYGDSNTGKSRIPATLISMVGVEATCSLSVEHMDDPQRRGVLIGKGLNVATELTTEALRADSGFKTLIATEEPILIDQKYIRPFMYLPTAKHVFATNTLPRLTDRSEEILNRLLLVPMDRVLPDQQQDRYLDDKLRAEMVGIILWAAQGARRLVERGGHWDVPQASIEAAQSYRESWNPVIAFIHENCEPQAITEAGDIAGEAVSMLRHKYNLRRGGDRPLGEKQMTPLLRKAGFTVRKVRHDGGVPVATLVGWSWVDRSQNESVLVRAADVVGVPDEEPIDVRGTRPHAFRAGK